MKDRIKYWWEKLTLNCWLFLPSSRGEWIENLKFVQQRISTLQYDMNIMKSNHETLQRNHSNLIKRLNKKHKLFAGIIENVPENITDLYSELNAFEEDVTSKIDKIREDLDSQIEYNREIDRKVGELNASAGKVMSQAFRGR